jgi:hypothetical protein
MDYINARFGRRRRGCVCFVLQDSASLGAGPPAPDTSQHHHPDLCAFDQGNAREKMLPPFD